MVIVAILGTVGVLLPVVSIARGERGSNPFYGIIALGALGASMAFVGYRLVTDSVHPATLFSQEVLSDDMFGAFFAIAMLIVAAMTTVGSFNYMRKHGHRCYYLQISQRSQIYQCKTRTQVLCQLKMRQAMLQVPQGLDPKGT